LERLMSGLLSSMLVFIAGIVGAVVGDMVSDEIRQRLDRLPLSLIQLACRRLPEPIRSDRAAEWSAELVAILAERGSTKLPISRLVVGIRFALGLFAATPAIRRSAASAQRPVDRQRFGVVAVIAVALTIPLLAAAIGPWLAMILADCVLLGVTVRIGLAAAKRRDQRSWAAALLLLPFTAFTTVQICTFSYEYLPSWVDLLVVCALMCQPFLALRFIATLRPVARTLSAAVAAVCWASVASVLWYWWSDFSGSEAVALMTVGTVSLMLLVPGIITVMRSARCAEPALRFQQVLGGVATTLLGVATASLIAMGADTAGDLASQVAVVTAALCYFLIVTPPRRLRLPWTRKEAETASL
jgi:hypothetical protein